MSLGATGTQPGQRRQAAANSHLADLAKPAAKSNLHRTMFTIGFVDQAYLSGKLGGGDHQ
jgi:hypothetical protein